MNRRSRRSRVEAGGEHAGDDVAADVGAQRREDERPGARGWTATPKSLRGGRRELVRGDDERRHRQRLGVDPERELHHRDVAADRDLVDLAGSTPASAKTSPASSESVSCARVAQRGKRLRVHHRGRDAGDHVGAVRLLAVEHRAHGRRLAALEVEQRRDDGRGAEVERDREPPVGRVARLEVDQLLVADDRGDVEVRRRAAITPSVRSSSSDACGSRSSIASSTRWRSERWSSSVGSSSTRWRFCTDGRRITWRPTPASAALGRVCSGGTSTTRSSRAPRAAGEPPAVAQLVGAERARVDRPDRHVARRRSAPCTSCTSRDRRTSSRSRSRSSSRRRTPACRSGRGPRRRRAGTAGEHGRCRRRGPARSAGPRGRLKSTPLRKGRSRHGAPCARA